MTVPMGSTPSAYATPYALFVGRWTGIANVFSPRGEFLRAFPGEIVIRWESERVLSYTQLIGDLDHLGADAAASGAGATRTTALLTVDGKAVSGENDDFLVE